jgi:hypothetical protein
VHNHARRLVDGEQIVVFMDDVEGRLLGGHDAARRELWKRHRHHVALGGAYRGSADEPAVDRDPSAFDPRLDTRSRGDADVSQVPAQDQVEAPSCIATIGCQDAR